MTLNILGKREFKIFLTVWVIYVFFISSYSGDWVSDSILSESLSLAHGHTFAADNYIKEACKQQGCDYAFFNGHFYSGFAPGATFLAVPLLFLFKPLFWLLPNYFMGYPNVQLDLLLANVLAIIFISSLLGAILTVVVYRFSKYFTQNRKILLLIAFSFAFGTLYFSYSIEYSTRVLAPFFSFCSFYLLFKNKHFEIKRKSLFLAGLFAGLSVFFDYTNALIVPLLFIYLVTFLRSRKVLYFVLGGCIIFLALVSYHYFIFGGPFTTPYDHRADKTTSKNFAAGFYEFSLPNLKKAWGLSFSPEKGIFFYVPITILSLFGAFLFLKERRRKYFVEMLIILLVFATLFLYNSSLAETSWRANCAFGPRYLAGVLPFLMLPLIFVYEKIGLKFSILFSVVSVFINFLPVLYGKTVLWRSFEGVGCNSTNVIFKEYLPLFFKRGLTNYTLNLINYKIHPLSVLWMNIITLLGLFILCLIIWFIWRKR